MKIRIEHKFDSFIDRSRQVRALGHWPSQFEANSRHTPQALAAEYLRRVAPQYGFTPGLLKEFSRQLSPRLSDEPPRLRFLGEKTGRDAHVVMYAQTVLGAPIWGQGFAVTLKREPLHVVSSLSTVEADVLIRAPSLLAPFLPERLDPARLTALRYRAPGWKFDGAALRVYCYRERERFASAHREKRGNARHPVHPTLPLDPVPASIIDGRYYVVSEVLFNLPLEDWGELPWRAMVEVQSGTVLYLRALINFHDVDAYVYNVDPPTRGWNFRTDAPTANLDMARQRTTLHLDPAQNPASVGLTGSPFVELVDIRLPTVAAPTVNRNFYQHFDYSVDTPEFAAVNAYHLTQRFGFLMASWGFDPRTFFVNTPLPIPVDFSVSITGQGIAFTRANSGGAGTSFMAYGPIETDLIPSVKVISSCHWRVVVHEFGHVLLNERAHDGSFGFAHGPGDAMAMILCDPGSVAPNRFKSDPWDHWSTGERLDRPLAGGFAWGGTEDNRSYSSGLLLSASLFRAYRAMGGDFEYAGQNPFPQRNERERWAEHLAQLMVRHIDALPLASTAPINSPEVYANGLMATERSMSGFRGVPGGLFHKLMRWSFEKQGAYQPAGTTGNVTGAGAAPAVDVYLDDGVRGGEYQWSSAIWNNPSIWSRNAPDGGTTHQDPVQNTKAYAYVRVKNRGSIAALGVKVRLFRHNFDIAAKWPTGFSAANPAQLSAGRIGPGGSAVVGPFEFTSPHTYDMLFAAVSAIGDLANVDPLAALPCTAGPAPLELLLRGDNNLGLRVINPKPGTGPRLPGHQPIPFPDFTNRFDRYITIELSLHMPKPLPRLGWRLGGTEDGALRRELEPGATWTPRVTLRPGKPPARNAGIGLAWKLEAQIHAIDKDNRLVGSGSLRIGLDPWFWRRAKPFASPKRGRRVKRVPARRKK